MDRARAHGMGRRSVAATNRPRPAGAIAGLDRMPRCGHPVMNITRTTMAASSKLMIGEAERRFPVRLRIAVPPLGLGSRLDDLKAWLDDNCGAGGWAITPSGV